MMKLFRRKTDPVFLKEDSQAIQQLENLQTLRRSLTAEGQKLLDKNANFLEYGIIGEQNIAFELQHSHMFMVVLKDMYLEFEGLSAQIDYLVFTRKHCYVIECKNLYGHIEINADGEFVRLLSFKGQKTREGMYSPVTQNQRHVDLIRKIVVEKQKNPIKRFSAAKAFDEQYKPIVVLANPKTILHTEDAKAEVRDQVIRADQLITYIKDTEKQSKNFPRTDKQVLAKAQAFLDLHQEVEKDYTAQYEPYKTAAEPEKPAEKSIEDTEVFKALRAYRLQMSRKEKIKAYYIYNNRQLKELIAKKPQTKQDLSQVEGFGEMKIEKYGRDLLKILSEYSAS